MKQEDTITTAQAQKMVLDMYNITVTLPTVISWVRKNDLGKQMGGQGRWFINKMKFEKFLKEGKSLDR